MLELLNYKPEIARKGEEARGFRLKARRES
jgi:hypothetical protein